MEIDALLLLTRLLKSLNFTETELLIMQSYIINKNIDINLSLRENACLLMEENITSIEMCKDVRSII
ncbi:MAG: hypothetical protein K2I70_01445, partial [Bacilli bacterium]|nr:hypothetical protein [Bacilli bacterium]